MRCARELTAGIGREKRRRRCRRRSRSEWIRAENVDLETKLQTGCDSSPQKLYLRFLYIFGETLVAGGIRRVFRAEKRTTRCKSVGITNDTSEIRENARAFVCECRFSIHSRTYLRPWAFRVHTIIYETETNQWKTINYSYLTYFTSELKKFTKIKQFLGVIRELNFCKYTRSDNFDVCWRDLRTRYDPRVFCHVINHRRYVQFFIFSMLCFTKSRSF